MMGHHIITYKGPIIAEPASCGIDETLLVQYWHITATARITMQATAAACVDRAKEGPHGESKAASEFLI